MPDVSDAVDLLLAGVTPEKVDEIKRTWGGQTDRVRLLEGEGFLLQQLYGTVQVNEIALRQIWLIGYAAEKAIEAYSGMLTLLASSGLPFDAGALKRIPGQDAADGAFDELLAQLRMLGDGRSLSDFQWPSDVPEPRPGMKFDNVLDKAAYDLVCMAGGYVFLHEIRHVLLERDGHPPSTVIDEERECDRYARSVLLDGLDNYAKANGWDPGAVKAKRLLSILIAKMMILVITPRAEWDNSETHPPVRERIRSALEAAGDDVPDWFWLSAAAVLAAFARAVDALPLNVPFATPTAIPFATLRELAFKICEVLTTRS